MFQIEQSHPRLSAAPVAYCAGVRGLCPKSHPQTRVMECKVILTLPNKTLRMGNIFFKFNLKGLRHAVMCWLIGKPKLKLII